MNNEEQSDPALSKLTPLGTLNAKRKHLETTPPPSHFGWIKAIFVAATLLLFTGGAAILLGPHKQKPVDWVKVNAVNGKQNVDLPDGSRILLRKGSSLAYPSDFGKIQRIIQFKGEAYFEVQYHPSQPFSVKTNNEITTQEGTSFFIRSNDSVEQVFVSEGRVRFGSSKIDGEFVVVNSGQKAELIENKIIRSVIKENYMAWDNERLIFDRTSLTQVAEDIYNYYGLPIKIGPGIDAEHIYVTAQFENQPLSNILKEIGARTQLQIRKEENQVVITKPFLPGLDNQKDITGEVKPRKRSWWQRFWGLD